jgi:hypothetical protein
VAIIKITDFGGLLPRVEPRALPPGAAQVNSNLLATSNSFRPLQDDSVVATGVSGAQTLYRLSRDSAGTLRTGDTTGWIAEAADKSYVKGQINDDATERTYVSFNDGTSPPRAIDALGADRLMGVPAPDAATATLNQVGSFTQEDANFWSDWVLLPGLENAIFDSTYFDDPGARFNATTKQPVAGPYAPMTGDGFSALSTPTFPVSQRGIAENWNLVRAVSTASVQSVGMGSAVLGGVEVGAYTWFAITALPQWPVIDSTQLRSTLAAMANPETGALLLTTGQLNNYIDAVLARYDGSATAVRSLRDQLQAEVDAFEAAFNFFLAGTPSRPTAPTKPTVPEYTTSGEGATSRNAAWVDYDTAIAAYNISLTDYNASLSDIAGQRTSKVARLAACQKAAAALTIEIERMGLAIIRGLNSWVGSLGGLDGLVKTEDNPNGLVSVVPDRIIDPRFYFATYGNDWGEESAPSAVTAMLEIDQYSSATITASAPPSGRNITIWTLYRSNVGNTTTAFQRVMSSPIATLTYTDTLKGEELGEACPTITWAEPPFRINAAASTENNLVAKGPDPYLRGLTGMPNGIMAGFVDNYVAFSDPYHPYAWPVEYQIPLGFEIVGLGVFGSSLFVGTYANPSIISGSDSASMSEITLDDSQACLSARSIVSAEGGVLYASPDGICFASLNGVEVLTTALFAREDWQLLNPESIVAAMHEGVYYMWYAGNGGGCYALDTVAKKLTHVDMTASSVFTDNLTDAVFYCDGTEIKRAFSTGRREGKWRTPRIELASPASLAWGKVLGDHTAANPITLTWYGQDDEETGLLLRYTKTVTSTAPWRLPPGRYLEHEIEISGAARVTKIFLASSTKELEGAA